MESKKKGGSHEPSGWTGIKMQMERIDLRKWGKVGDGEAGTK